MTRTGPAAFLICLTLLGLESAMAQAKPDTVTPIQGAATIGRLQSIADGTITLVGVDGKLVKMALGAVRTVQFGRRNPSPVPRQGMVLLRSGVRLPATVRRSSGRKFSITSPLLEGEATYSLTRVQAIRFAKLPAIDQGGFGRYLNSPKEDKDLLYFKSGERIVQQSVTIEGFEDGSLTYTARGKSRSRKVSSLYGLIMAKNSGFRADPLPRPRVVITTQGGTSLSGRLEHLDQKSCKILTEEQVELNVVRSRITSLTVESDRLIFLSDLQPTRVEQTAAFRRKSAWMVNRSPLGDGIHIGGDQARTADNGLVLIPRTQLTYDIGGKFDFFEATLCIDARSTGPAHAVFRVKNGDKLLYESKPVTRQSEPFTIKVPIGKVIQLTIEADFGKNFDFGDHCAFAEARVIKQGS